MLEENMFILFNLLFITFLKAENNSSSDVLKLEIYQKIKNEHIPLKYKDAGEILFTKLDNNNGSICSIYDTDNCLITNTVPNAKLMNIEHSWPQSEGANGVAKSDLHHLFIADSNTNSIRSSLPFCDVIEIKWTNGESKRGFGKYKEHCFEPPQRIKGDIARALFYFSIRYQVSMGEQQENYFRLWNKQDSITEDEQKRNLEIKKFQGNSNPFIEDNSLVDKILKF